MNYEIINVASSVSYMLSILLGSFFFFIFVCLFVPVPYGNFWARDQTHTTAVTQATGVKTPDLLHYKGTPYIIVSYITQCITRAVTKLITAIILGQLILYI